MVRKVDIWWDRHLTKAEAAHQVGHIRRGQS